MRRTVIALAALSILAGCAVIVVPDGEGGVSYKSGYSSKAVEGDGNNVVETRQVATLDGLDVTGPMQVEVRVGQQTALQLQGDANILPLVRTDASGGTLRVWVEGSIRSNSPIRVTYSTPALRHLSANGSGSVTVTGLNRAPLELSQNGSGGVRLSGNVTRLDARLSGSGGLNAADLDSGSVTARLNSSGRLELGRISGDALSLDLRGSGGATASGSVRTMTVRLNGSGSADLAGLSAQSADLSSNGSGGISATVTQSVVAYANGSGGVTVYGNPAQRNVSGKRVTIVN
ncbi:hypothetical protein FHW58_004604 [Duganella sp. 1224]|uniref:GIN domain-containing protein n=1 Tax=Duganella sp. 1224 TaxID=2587052 RepID=UPI0015C9A6C4|nr:DUF2807 domain-containing protein [Duganella sp. 1224]NYE63374.1 hypothetical protein [Duganella sp. 1224]